MTEVKHCDRVRRVNRVVIPSYPTMLLLHRKDSRSPFLPPQLRSGEGQMKLFQFAAAAVMFASVSAAQAGLFRHHGSDCCAPEPSCCAPAEPTCCAPAEPTCCAPAAPSCCAPVAPTCCAPVDTCCSSGCGHKSWFKQIKGCKLFKKGCHKSSCCEPSCCAPEPSCCAPAAPTCCAPVEASCAAPCGPTCAAPACCN